MFNNSRPGRLAIGIIDRCISLEIRLIQQLRLETHRAVFQSSQTIPVIGINRTCKNHLVRQCIQLLLLLQIIRVQPYLNPLQHALCKLRIAAHRNPLIQSIEIIVVKGQAYRKSPYDKRRELGAGSPPLLLRISLNQLLVDIHADQ